MVIRHSANLFSCQCKFPACFPQDWGCPFVAVSVLKPLPAQQLCVDTALPLLMELSVPGRRRRQRLLEPGLFPVSLLQVCAELSMLVTGCQLLKGREFPELLRSKSSHISEMVVPLKQSVKGLGVLLLPRYCMLLLLWICNFFFLIPSRKSHEEGKWEAPLGDGKLTSGYQDKQMRWATYSEFFYLVFA